MPYASDRQRRFFHTEAAQKAGITPGMVREFDAAEREKRGGAFGMPSLPKPPKAPNSTTKPMLPGSRPLTRGLGAPAPVTAHKPLEALSTRAVTRASDNAGMSTGAKLGTPPGGG